MEEARLESQSQPPHGDGQTPSGFSADETALSLRVLQTSPDCIKIIDLEGKIRFMNEAGQKLMEVDDFATLRGCPWISTWPESFGPELSAAFDKARRGETSRLSGLCPTMHGTPKWWDVVLNPYRGTDGTVEWILAISRDITESKTFERRLQESEQRFRALADNMSQLAWMGDPSGAIFWYNQRWFDYTGTDIEQMAGWGWQSVHHPDHVDRVVRKIKAYFVRGEVWEDTFPLRGANGEYRWFLSRARPLKDAGGNVVLWCGTNTDITDQRNSSMRLRQMARLVELSHEAILVWDLKDGIVLWNEGCESLYGYTRNEAVGRRSHDLLKTVHPGGTSEFEQLLLSQGQWTGEIVHRAKDGSVVWVDSRQELVKFGDRHVVLETNRDITERRRADETRNLLVAELNHRVKNTLAIVQSIASQTARATSNPQRFVSAFNERLQALSSAHNVLTDANWKGAQLVDLITRQLADSQGRFDRIETQGQNVFVGAQTALQLGLIFNELATNARKYGALTRAAGRVNIDWHVEHGASPHKLSLTWRESGGPSVQTPTRSGFGLTLITRAGSQPNLQAAVVFDPEGVICSIRADLPDDESLAEAAYFNPAMTVDDLRGRFISPSGDSPRQTARTRARVLIIEDEPLIAMEIEGILADGGFVTAGPVASVVAALQAITDERFDVALVDGNLLGESVEPVVDELLARRIPFAFATGADRDRLSEAYRKIPFVKKPIVADELIETVKTLLTARP